MTPNSQQKSELLSAEAFEVRIWGFVVVSVTLILCFIVVALLYSVTFVTQPIKSMAPIDQAYTKMLNDIVLLIVGGIGGVMTKRAVGAASKAFGAPQTPPQTMMQQPMMYMPQPMMGGYAAPGYSNNHGFTASTNGIPAQPFGAMPTWTNPELDESWTPGPPPTTPPDHLEDDHERVQLAAARQEAE